MNKVYLLWTQIDDEKALHDIYKTHFAAEQEISRIKEKQQNIKAEYEKEFNSYYDVDYQRIFSEPLNEDLDKKWSKILLLQAANKELNIHEFIIEERVLK